MKRSVTLALALLAFTLPGCSGGEETPEELPAPVEEAPVPEAAPDITVPDTLPVDTTVTPGGTDTLESAEGEDVNV